MKAGWWMAAVLGISSLGAMTLSASALAADDGEWNCEHPGSTMEVDMCMSAELERADAALDIVHAEAVRRLREGQGDGCSQCAEAGATLEQAQQEWSVFRDTDCMAMLMANIDGTGRNAAELECKIEHARFREQRLRRQYLD